MLFGAEELPFNEWCRRHGSGGALTFQELSSLLPPLLAGVESGHRILDLCAAPGSKSSQTVDLMMTHAARQPVTGMVLCCDKDRTKASRVLPSRLCPSGCPAVLVAHAAGAGFPSFFPRTADQTGFRTGAPDRVVFDRVFADVPCSGDGTVRKNPDIWCSFNHNYGVDLHHRQYKLLLRGLSMLQVGGRLVYSTCSFDPVQNEAVVAAALARMSETVALEAPAHVPGVTFRPGSSIEQMSKHMI